MTTLIDSTTTSGDNYIGFQGDFTFDSAVVTFATPQVQRAGLTSDPNWNDGRGQVWRIDKDGSVKRVADKMGTANGIEVSPDGKTLYVNESGQLVIEHGIEERLDFGEVEWVL